jgi:TrmH family RNA methyltransferase
MMSLHKLQKLPPKLKLRKIVKLVGKIEYRLLSGIAVQADELDCLQSVLVLLQDMSFPPESAELIQKAENALKTPDSHRLLRFLNTVRHILLAETGCAPADWDFLDATGCLDPQKRRRFPGMKVYLEDIRSPFNVGSMFRTAESFGVDQLFLSPFCADPAHRRAERAAAGCVSVIPWERLAEADAERLEVPVFALETGGTLLKNFSFPPYGLMIVGSEELGVSPQALSIADASLGRVSIPVYGAKGSLNAAVAFGIALQSWAEAIQR